MTVQITAAFGRCVAGARSSNWSRRGRGSNSRRRCCRGRSTGRSGARRGDASGTGWREHYEKGESRAAIVLERAKIAVSAAFTRTARRPEARRRPAERGARRRRRQRKRATRGRRTGLDRNSDAAVEYDRGEGYETKASKKYLRICASSTGTTGRRPTTRPTGKRRRRHWRSPGAAAAVLVRGELAGVLVDAGGGPGPPRPLGR